LQKTEQEHRGGCAVTAGPRPKALRKSSRGAGGEGERWKNDLSAKLPPIPGLDGEKKLFELWNGQQDINDTATAYAFFKWSRKQETKMKKV